VFIPQAFSCVEQKKRNVGRLKTGFLAGSKLDSTILLERPVAGGAVYGAVLAGDLHYFLPCPARDFIREAFSAAPDSFNLVQKFWIARADRPAFKFQLSPLPR
jgi:hypothetical protein